MKTVWRPEPAKKTDPVWVMFSLSETGEMSLTGVCDDNYMAARKGAESRAKGGAFCVINFMKSFDDIRSRLISFLHQNGVTDDEEIIAYLNNTGYRVAQLFGMLEPMCRRLQNQHGERFNFNGDPEDRSPDQSSRDRDSEGPRILSHNQEPMAGLEITP